MRDVNGPLKRQYFTRLTGITVSGVSVPAYYGELPSGKTDKNYIVYGAMSSNDNSTKSSADTSTTIQVTIFTQKDINNDGNAVDDIADQLLARIYANPGTSLNLGANLQAMKTRLVSDSTSEMQVSAQLKYIDRIFVFSHQIYHNDL